MDVNSNTLVPIIAAEPFVNELFAQLKPASLDFQIFTDGNEVERTRLRQNGAVPLNFSDYIQIRAIDSTDTLRNVVDRTFVDQGEAIGITDGDDGNSSSRKRIDGDEILSIKLISPVFSSANSVSISLEQLRTDGIDGGDFKLIFLDQLGSVLGESIWSSVGSDIEEIEHSDLFFFSEVQIQPVNESTRFTFRSARFITPPVISITATDANTQEGNIGDSAVFTIASNVEVADDLLLNYIIEGSATESDYTPFLSGEVIIPAGQTSTSIVINSVDDTVVESTETLTLRLVSADSLVTIPESSVSASISISDNDVLPIVSLFPSSFSIREGEFSLASIGFARSGSTSESLRVYYSISGTAISADFSPPLSSGFITIPAGQSTIPGLRISPVSDGIEEPDETLILTLIDTADYDLGTGSEVTVTIRDTLPFVGIEATDSTASESNDPGVFTIRRLFGAPTTSPLVVNYRIEGTATSDDYFPILSGTATIPSGATSTSIIITPIDDTIVETEETLTLRLLPGEYRGGVTSVLGSTITIADNDFPGNLVPSFQFTNPLSTISSNLNILL